MAGQIKKMIDSIIQQRAKGDSIIENCIRAKLAIKGIDPDVFNESSEDDPNIVSKLSAIAAEMGVTIN